MKTRIPILVVALAALGLSTAARAEPKDDARRHFKAGLMAIEEGDLDLALQRFLAAQEAYPHEATLYNIARVYADMGDLSNALVYYRMYRDQTGDDEAVNVDPVIQAIEARTGAAPIQVTAPTDTPAPSDGSDEELTESEVARLGDIRAELGALSEAFKSRGAENASANAGQAAEILENPTAPSAVGVNLGELGVGDETVDITELDLEALGVSTMITDAYDRSVVTASRRGQDPLDSPSTLTVVTQEDIRLSGVTTITDLMRRVVGVDIAQMGGGHTDISIRGFNRELNNKVLVLIDGRSTYWDSFGATLWPALPIVLEEIDRIEIIRGPGSAVYGANAVTGVINIITKTPGEREETIVHVDAGTIGYRRGSVVTVGTLNEHRYRFSAGFGEHGRFERDLSLTEEQLQDEDQPIQTFFDDQTRATAHAKVHGRIDRTFGRLGYASISGGYNDGKMEYYNIAALPVFAMEWKHNTLRGDFHYGVFHLRSFWNRNHSYTGAWAQPRDIRYENYSQILDDSVDVEMETPLEFTTGAIDHELNVGVGYRYKSIAMDYLRPNNGSLANPNIQHHLSGFVNEQISAGPVDVVGSFRVDRHPFIQDITQTMSPRLAGIVRVAENTSVRATAGRAFRAPNALELLADYELPTPFDGVWVYGDGDANLLPEKITTYELGVHDESTDFHVLDVVGYANILNDAIWLPDIEPKIDFWDPDPGGFRAGDVPFSNVLGTNYVGYGIEAEARIFPTDGMDLFANVSLQQLRRDSSQGNAAIEGQSGVLPNTLEQAAELTKSGDPDDIVLPSFSAPASTKLNGGWMYRTPVRTDLTLMAHYVGPQVGNAHQISPTGIVVTPVDIPARFLMSSRVAIRPTKDENLELAITGWNMTAGKKGWIDHAKGQHLRARYHGTVRYTF